MKPKEFLAGPSPFDRSSTAIWKRIKGKTRDGRLVLGEKNEKCYISRIKQEQERAQLKTEAYTESEVLLYYPMKSHGRSV